MSSENLSHGENGAFKWHGVEDVSDYLFATYLVSTPVDGEQAAYGLAREQSVCTTSLEAIEFPPDMERFCAKVAEVEPLARQVDSVAPLYFLNTPVYGPKKSVVGLKSFRVVIGYPLCLVGDGLTRLWNTVFGEVHRLGYLAAVTLLDIDLPEKFLHGHGGPKFGVAGIQDLLGVNDRPLFCRSMRPAAGLDTDAMLRLNESVLTGGFDVIKDDELTYDSIRSPFADRVARMVEMKHRVEQRTGERKLYFANVIDDFPVSIEMAERAAALGADGVLVSPGAQGLSVILEVARRTDLIILSHNSCGDALTRADAWGASDAVMAKLQRVAGADLVATPGPFATPYQNSETAEALLRACGAPEAGLAATMPIIMGGKQPERLAAYVEAMGSTDFMIIAATWVDHHPEGMQVGARAFRDAWDRLASQEASG